MIIGIGNDLVRIDRIEQTLERFGERFIQRVAKVDRAPILALTGQVQIHQPSVGRSVRRAMPSALPPRKPVPRRWVPGFRDEASTGATWAW